MLCILLGFGSSVPSSSFMASSLPLYLLGFLVFVSEVTISPSTDNSNRTDMVMEEKELLGLFEVLDAFLEDPDWAQDHPQPCTDTPWPGIQCEIGDEDSPIFHITKIHIGPDILNPPCKSSSALPKSLDKLPYLKTLSIFSCFVASQVILSPTLFTSSSSLEHLALDSNPTLVGTIPSTVSQVASLRVLSLSQNNLQGNIPFQLGGLANLEQLDLSYNNLTGEIPQEIGGLKSLTILDMSCNSLEGQVPSSLGQLQLLQKIDLGSNKIQGRVPADLGKLKRLVLLDLSHNFINGPMPLTLSGLDQLQYIILDNNPINSGIPLFLVSLNKLTSISLSYCSLTGPISNFLSSLKNLTALSLDNNMLTGPLPSNLGSLPNLDQLNVSHNQLSGEILLPEEFIEKLGERLDVRGNNGLCSSKKLYSRKNISLYLAGTPVCLETVCINGDNNTCPEENPDGSKGKQTPWYHGKPSSKAPLCPHHRKLLFCTCLLISWLWLMMNF